MHAIRLILVYFGTAFFALAIAGRYLRPISRRARLSLALLPLVLTGRAVLTGGFLGPLQVQYASVPIAAQRRDLPPGDYSYGILSDVAILNIPWAKAVRESVKHGRLPLLNRFILSGDVLLGAFQPMVFHPNTILGFLLPLAEAWTFGCALNLFLAALFAFLYLREVGVAEAAAFFGSGVWMLSAFLVFWIGWDIAPAFAPFPLLLLGLRRIAKGERGGIPIAAGAMLLSLLAGHPESLLHQVAAGGAYFLWELRQARRFARPIVSALLSGALCLGLAAPALLPFLEALPQTFESSVRKILYSKEEKSWPLPEAARSAAAAVYPNLFGYQWKHWRPGADLPRGADAATGAFVGGLALTLAGFGLFSSRKERWPILGIGLVSFLVAVGMPGFAGPVSRLPLFNIALNARLSGVTALCLAILSAFGLEKILSGHSLAAFSRAGFLIGAALAAGGILLLPMASAHGVSRRDFALSVALTAAPALLVAAAARLFGARPEILLAASLSLFFLFRLAELPRLYPVFPSRLFAPKIEELERLPKGGEPYRVAGLGYSLPADQGALYELEDPRGYTSMTNQRYYETMPLWSVVQPVWFNRIDDPSSPFLSLLNVRFLVSHSDAAVPRGWRLFTRGPHCSIFETPKVLGRAFSPARILFAPNRAAVLAGMSGCSDFAKSGWIEDPNAPPGELANSPAAVAVQGRGGDLLLDVDASGPAWIVVSQAAWKGWKAEEEGRAIPLRFANNAFLAFRVGAGKHRVRLAYRPDSFRYGVVLFALTAFSAAAATIVRRASSAKGSFA